ncbi:Xaa-Pro aminopeptidase [Parabacteroides sp. PF5-5]|uniref:aminopeptidase P family protein n=1 Tax=unclassified Parabacteroides TaxID=2649774 RepID=UPI002474F45C|nr:MULTISPECIES: aminopeptidase P family protein [unclassified Parabacteroides]MDH6304070.1 Xaa-Pro aminopeptidase [Parabacteroides sp. PH5-39]MDH6315230.1 Xaa-Pro aminopeptidase [Parabacteroides sp. PF5-13]MDH6318875.1 Xaa-Pro aminopeptidase [Parabacteroides sp. PH5-13]MDH6322604.1 Xaa-Pro aminopeptidase [Parabacteroides sp. PH5-8]MDH6326244.1 Xaa-Pro aminopeptidase [Parabacteroides sp. PH5-41]
MFNKKTYIARRAKLKQTLGSGLLLFLGNDESGMNYADNTYHFRQDSTFLYFFGLPYAGLNAIIDIDNDKEIVFGDELTIDSIVWMGTQPTLKEKGESIGITDIRPAKEIEEYLKNAQQKKQAIHYLPTYRAEHQVKLLSWLGIFPGTEKPSVPFILGVVNQRNYKTEEEIVELEKACTVTADMHLTAMRMVRPGIYESEVAAAVAEVAYASNYQLSFPIIATINGQTLHNHYHGNMIKSGDMLLLDAGAETEMGYAGDMSSTIPADSTFTTRQKEIYDISVAAHEAAVAALRPGVVFEEVYDLALKVIMEGLKEMGFVKGDPMEAVKAGAAALFMPCGLGHMLGLDTHDMENLGEVYVGYDGRPKSTQFGRKSLRLGRKLEPGFVLTIEPGIYFIPELIDLWKGENKFTEFINYEKVVTYKDFSGIRNEEDYLITENGARLLGKKIPIRTEEVESLR